MLLNMARSTSKLRELTVTVPKWDQIELFVKRVPEFMKSITHM
jgi:hypothetical protein